MGDATVPPPENPAPAAVSVPVPAPPDTTFSVSTTTSETWAQWMRSDKFLLLTVYVFLVIMLFHAAHDPADKDLEAFMENGATGAFSGLMVALRGKQDPK